MTLQAAKVHGDQQLLVNGLLRIINDGALLS